MGDPQKEVNQLLDAIVEVSQSVSRMPCPPEQKEEVLEKVKHLFSCYNSVSTVISSLKSGNTSSGVDGTDLKACYTAAGGEGSQMHGQIQLIDQKLCSLEQRMNLSEQNVRRDAEQVASGLRTEFANHIVTLNQIRGTQDSICNRVGNIENKSNEFADLQNRIQEISAIVGAGTGSGVGTTLTGLQDEITKVYAEVANLEELVHTGIAQAPKDTLAFSAKASRSISYKPGHVIQFSDVALNLKDCYDPRQGVFRCKSFGLYVFASSINTNSHGDFEASIERNDEEVVLFGTTGQKDLQTGSSVVMQLQPGDIVCVKAKDNADVEIGGGFSNFVGYKIA